MVYPVELSGRGHPSGRVWAECEHAHASPRRRLVSSLSHLHG